MAKYSLLAYCGLYCGGCRSYEENSDVGCKGCRDEQTLVDDCPTRACAMRKAILHCGECDVFPCDVLNGFYTDGIAHHALAYENTRGIGTIGTDEWLLVQEREHTCQCGKRKLWFARGCTHHTG